MSIHPHIRPCRLQCYDFQVWWVRCHFPVYFVGKYCYHSGSIYYCLRGSFLECNVVLNAYVEESWQMVMFPKLLFTLFSSVGFQAEYGVTPLRFIVAARLAELMMVFGSC